MVLDVVAGPDSKDSTCIPSTSRRSAGDGDGGFASGLLSAAAAASGSSGPLEGVTVGIPREFNVEELGENAIEIDIEIDNSAALPFLRRAPAC